MTMNIMRTMLIATVLIPGGAIAAQQNDLREFRVGMPLSALPDSGYSAFACTGDPSRKLAGWGDFSTCPAQPDGTHAISFRYGDNGKTQVGGQPVTLALLIDDNAQVAGIRIETDPHTGLYIHKKAFLFALQVRARFGEDGWTCQQMAQTPTQQPVGGVFIHEHCEKTTESRHFSLDRQLFHNPAEDLRDFTDATQLTIRRQG
jgi:hypothetical protein